MQDDGNGGWLSRAKRKGERRLALLSRAKGEEELGR